MTISQKLPISGWMSSEYGKTTIIAKDINTTSPWTRVRPIQEGTLDTKDTWEIFKLNVNNEVNNEYRLPLSFIHVFKQVIENTEGANHYMLEYSELYDAFCRVNDTNNEKDNSVIIPGVEIINGKKVFTLFDDNAPNQKTISSQGGRMRFFDFETGKEITPQEQQQEPQQQGPLPTVTLYDWYKNCRSGTNLFGATTIDDNIKTNQSITWEQINDLHGFSLNTKDDDIFVLQLNGDYDRLGVLAAATNWNSTQTEELKSSDLYKAFDAVNQGGFGCEGCHIPGKEIINGQEVFTLFDDEQATQKNFTLKNPKQGLEGKMRYFDAQTGRELYTWLPKGVNIRDTEKVRTAINNNLKNMDSLSWEQRVEIVNFYFNNVDIENLNDDEKKMLRSMYYTSNTYTNPEKEIEYCQKVATPYIENELKKNREALQHYKAELEELEKTVTYTYKNRAEFEADLNATKEDGTKDYERFDKAVQFHHKLVLQSAISTLESLISYDEFELGQINNKVENLRGTK